MKTREILEISTIVILAIILIQILPTHFNSQNFNVLKNESIEISQNSTVVANAEEPEFQIQSQDDTTYYLDSNNKLTQIFKQVENSVVQITSKVSVTNSHIIINGNPLEQQSTRLGSGFVYDKIGHIITNAHVVQGAEKVDVSFINGDRYTATVIGTDPHSDIAVLKINDELIKNSLKPIPITDSSLLDVGQQVIAIGNPFGLSNSMTTGIISQTGRILPNSEFGFSIPNVIQTDAAINPGNSGGPLLNMEGKVIGINTAIKSNTGDFSGIGFAVPSNIVKKIVPVLIKDGKYVHPWLGITGTSLNPNLAEALDLPQNYKGVVVSQVIKDGSAADAGLHEATYNASGELKSADIIISLDAKPMNAIDDVIIYIFEEKNVGDEIIITINRDGKILDLQTTLQARPE